MTEYTLPTPIYNPEEVKRQIAQRNELMKNLRDQGKTLDEIGKLFNLTKQRVHQILNERMEHEPR